MNLQTRPTGARLEAVQGRCACMKAEHQGDLDASTTLNIWHSFKWAAQKTCSSIEDVEAQLELAIQKCAEIKTEVVREMAIKRLREMATQLKELGAAATAGSSAA